MGLLLNIVLGITISRKDLDLLQFLWPLCHIGLIDCMLFFLPTRIFHSFEDAIHYVGEFQLSGGVHAMRSYKVNLRGPLILTPQWNCHYLFHTLGL